MGTFYYRITEAKTQQLLAGGTLEVPVAGERFRLGDFTDEMLNICRTGEGGTVTVSHAGLGAVSSINLRVIPGDRPALYRVAGGGRLISCERRGLRRLLSRDR